MSDTSPLRTTLKSNKPKVQFFYHTPTNNKQNANTLSPAKFNQNDISIIKKDSKHYCYNCGKQATYKASTSCKNYCTFCSVAQMMKGLQLVETKTVQIKFAEKTQPTKKPELKVLPRQIHLQNFVKEIQNQQVKINNLLEQSIKCQEDVKNKYSKKREQAIIYYEKLSKAIKISLNLDMQVLNNLQKQELSFIIQPRQILKLDISKLNGIKLDIKPNIQRIVEKVQEKKYVEFMHNYKQQLKRITQQYFKIQKNLYKSGINSSIEQKSQFCDPGFYRIFQNQQSTMIQSSDACNGIFFSFEKKK